MEAYTQNIELLHAQAEVRRLRERNADLETALTLQEGLYKELALELTTTKLKLSDTQDELHHELTVLTPHQHTLPSWLNEEPRDDNGEYARGVRVP